MGKKKKARPVAAPVKKDAPEHFERLLKGSFHHYSAVFHGRFSRLLDLLFRFLFGRVGLEAADGEVLQKAAEKGAVCYVTRGRSRLEYLLLSFRLRQADLPYPQFCHYLSVYLWQPWRITLRRLVGVAVSLFEGKGYPNPYRNGYVRRMVVEKVPTLLPLHHFGGLPWRFSRQRLDPLQELIRLRRESGRTIMVVPVVIVYGRRPDRDHRSLWDMIAGASDNPGRLRRLFMFLRHSRDTYIKVSEPKELGELEALASMRVPMMADRLPETAYHIRQECLERIEAERRIVLGPARKSRAETIEMVLHERNFVSSLLDYCKTNEQPFVETRRRARRYLEEMAADLRPGIVGFLRWVLDRLLGRVYESVEVDLEGLEKVRRTVRRMPVVFMPSHKSHIDYILLNYVLYKNYVHLPFTISGVNLNFWPLGSIFRGAGAFFMRRSFRGKRIYTLCFVKYLEALLREGVSLTFYVEGGRSRVGKLLPPKLGFLQYLLQAAIGAGRREIAFVPVSIGYERIFEETFYTNEAAGKPNEGESLRTVLKHRRLLGKKRGRVWIDFGEPIQLREMLWEDHISTIPRDVNNRRELASAIAHRAVNSINKEQPVTPYALVAEAVLASTRRGMPAELIGQRFQLLVDYLQNTTKLPGLTGDHQATVQRILDTMVAEKSLSVEEGEEADEAPFYFLDEGKRLSLTIYANTVVPHHQYLSLLALVLLASKEPRPEADLFSEFSFLLRLMVRELVLGQKPGRSAPKDKRDFDRALQVFLDRGWLEQTDAGFELTGDGRFAAETFGSVVGGYVEAYHLAARALLLRKAETFSDKEFVKAALKKGTRLASMGELDHPEAVHQLLLKNALQRYTEDGYIKSEMVIGDKTKIAGRTYQVADFVELEKTIERTRVYLPKLA